MIKFIRKKLYKLKEINYTKTEIAVFAFGLIIMFLGALIESNTIIKMS